MKTEAPGHHLPLQSDFLAHIPIDDIPSGVTIPETILYRFVKQKAWVLNYGCGLNQKHQDMSEIGLDINEHAIEAVRSRGINSLAYIADVTRFEIPKLNIASLAYLENTDVVMMEALLCNITGREKNGKIDGNDWKRAITAAHIALAPGGYLIVGDMLRADCDNPVLSQKYTSEELMQWRKRWNDRYHANRAIGLPDGVFYVAKPGPHKDAYDFGSPEELQYMIKTGNFERYARHFTLPQIARCTASLGFRVAYQEYAVFMSRNGYPLSGFFLVLQKQDRYQYHHRYFGMTEAEATVAKHADDGISLEQQLNELYARLPEPDYYFPSLKEWISRLR